MKHLNRMTSSQVFALVLVLALIFTLYAPSAYAAQGDTGTTAEGFVWAELPGSVIVITGYTGAGGDISIPSWVNGLPVTSIAASAFYSMSGITGVDIPAGVISIGNDAFSGCSNLSIVTLHSGLQTIGNGAFWSTALTGIDIPSSVTFIGNNAFSTCLSLSSVTLHSGLQTIGDGAFWSAALSRIDIPASVTSIGKDAFSSCGSLSSVTLHSGLQTIGKAAFWKTALTSIDIPTSVTSIDDDAFSTCGSLAKAVIMSKTMTCGANIFWGTKIGTDGIYGLAGSSAQTYASSYSIPFHVLYAVSFDTDGGTSIEDSIVFAGDTLSAPSDPVRSGYVFGGWYLEADRIHPAVFPLSISEDKTLYAKWTQQTKSEEPIQSAEPILTLSLSDNHLYTGGRVTITPSVAGGVWSFDGAYLMRDGNTFTGLKAGTTRVTYTVGQASIFVEITISQSVLPQTGQNYTMVWALGGAGMLAAFAALASLVAKKARKHAK